MSIFSKILPRVPAMLVSQTIRSQQMVRPLSQWRQFHSSRSFLAQTPSSTPPPDNATLSTSATVKDKTELVVDHTKGDGILCIGLNNPSVKNALGIALMHQFDDVMEKLKDDESIRVVILHSLVPGAFCAGANLKERIGMDESEVGPFVSKARSLFQKLYALPQPTLCAIDGVALGGGLEMALACDLRAASHDAIMGLVETRLAIIPGAGGTQRLPRLVGASRAKEMIFLAQKLNGEQAAKIGLVNWSVPQNASGTAAFELCLEHARTMATKAGPLALRWSKVSIDRGLDEPNWNDALDMEDMCYSQIISTEDRQEGLKAFLEKRLPLFKGV